MIFFLLMKRPILSSLSIASILFVYHVAVFVINIHPPPWLLLPPPLPCHIPPPIEVEPARYRVGEEKMKRFLHSMTKLSAQGGR